MLSNPSTSKALTSPCTRFQTKARKWTRDVKAMNLQPGAMDVVLDDLNFAPEKTMIWANHLISFVSDFLLAQ